MHTGTRPHAATRTRGVHGRSSLSSNVAAPHTGGCRSRRRVARLPEGADRRSRIVVGLATARPGCPCRRARPGRVQDDDLDDLCATRRLLLALSGRAIATRSRARDCSARDRRIPRRALQLVAALRRSGDVAPRRHGPAATTPPSTRAPWWPPMPASRAGCRDCAGRDRRGLAPRSGPATSIGVRCTDRQPTCAWGVAVRSARNVTLGRALLGDQCHCPRRRPDRGLRAGRRRDSAARSCRTPSRSAPTPSWRAAVLRDTVVGEGAIVETDSASSTGDVVVPRFAQDARPRRARTRVTFSGVSERSAFHPPTKMV